MERMPREKMVISRLKYNLKMILFYSHITADKKIKIINSFQFPQDINNIICSYSFHLFDEIKWKYIFNMSLHIIENAFMSRNNLFNCISNDENDPHWSFVPFSNGTLQLQAINCPKCGNYQVSHTFQTIYCDCNFFN